MAKREHWTVWLRKLHPCKGGLLWASGVSSVRDAWLKCNNSGWLLWLAAQMIDSTMAVTAHDAEDGTLGPEHEEFFAAVGDAIGASSEAVALCAGGALWLGNPNDIRALLPTPTLADLKAAARGECPWELV